MEGQKWQTQAVHTLWGQTRVEAVDRVRQALQQVSLRARGVWIFQEVLGNLRGHKLPGLPRACAQTVVIGSYTEYCGMPR